MVKKKKLTKKRAKGIYKDSSLMNLCLNCFKKHPTKRFNYRQVCKVLKIKDSVIKTRVVEVLNKLSEHFLMALSLFKLNSKISGNGVLLFLSSS